MAARAQEHKNMNITERASNRRKKQPAGSNKRQRQQVRRQISQRDAAVRKHLHRMPLPLMRAEGKGTKCERGRMEFRNAANRVTCHYGSSIFVLLTFLINS